MNAPDLSVLVPVYNNAATLAELIDRLVAVLDPLGVAFEMIFVDDGSRDDSLTLLQARASREPRLRVFSMVRNYGSQAASCAACDQARGRRIVHIDADLENFPEDIPLLLAELDRGADFVCGYREHRGDSWWARRMPSQLLNLYVRRRTGFAIRDVGCGLRAAETWIVKDLEAEGEGRRFLTPVLLRRARHVAEVPVRHKTKAVVGGHSFLTLLGIALDYYMLTAKRPFLIGGLAAFAWLGLGVLLLLCGRGLAGLVLCTGGGLGLLMSLLGEYGQRLYQLGQNVAFYQLRDLDDVDQPPAERHHATRHR